MRTGRPKALLTMSSDERSHLLAITRSRSLPAALTLRAKIVLACQREPSNAVVAVRLGVGPHTIGNGANALSPIGSRASMMRCAPAGPARSRTKRWPS
jgi:putative transposase